MKVWHGTTSNGAQVGSGDDRTGIGVHEGLSCLACHQKHGQQTRASCANCHPRLSNCGLDVEKMEAGSMELDYASLSAADLVAGALRQVAWLAESEHTALVTQIAAGLPPFQGDDDKLCRALINLLGNAIKFTPTGGTVTITARHDDAGAMLFSVRDTGKGIPAEAFERIFEKFGQVDSHQRMSNGLGLTFCKLAVEAHGGSIKVESVLGEGSTFSFTIPIERASA